MALFTRARRSRKATLLAIVLVASIVLLTFRTHVSSREHHLAPEAFEGSSLEAGHSNMLTPQHAAAACQMHGFSPYQGSRKVYDLIMFSTELDWLEIRLHTLAPYVDYFVIIESPTTFTSRPKPLLLKQNWNRFKDFHEKIIYKIVEDEITSTRIWDHEDFLRNSMLTGVFPDLVGTPQAASKNDVLVVSDMDEVLRPSAMLLMRYCQIPARLTLRTHFYYYSFQWRHIGEQWPHPDATLFSDDIVSTLSPNDLRQGLLGSGFAPLAAIARWWDRGTLFNAGWHCSSCFATVDEMRTKMHSFSHQGWNTAGNRDAETMIERVRLGLDLFGRADQVYERIESNQDVPTYILGQHQKDGRFGYLLDRDGIGAGFEDWDVVSAHN